MKAGEFGERVVPIVPDEARTFGMDPLFSEFGIYAPEGQLYKPVDHSVLMKYKESQSGQILEEGINEAGAMSTFIASGRHRTLHSFVQPYRSTSITQCLDSSVSLTSSGRLPIVVLEDS